MNYKSKALLVLIPLTGIYVSDYAMQQNLTEAQQEEQRNIAYAMRASLSEQSQMDMAIRASLEEQSIAQGLREYDDNETARALAASAEHARIVEKQRKQEELFARDLAERKRREEARKEAATPGVSKEVLDRLEQERKQQRTGKNTQPVAPAPVVAQPVRPNTLFLTENSAAPVIDKYDAPYFVVRAKHTAVIQDPTLVYDTYMQTLQTRLAQVAPGSIEHKMLFGRMAAMNAINIYIQSIIANEVARLLGRPDQELKVLNEIATGQHIEADYIRNTAECNGATNPVLYKAIHAYVHTMLAQSDIEKRALDLLGITQKKFSLSKQYYLIDSAENFAKLNKLFEGLVEAALLVCVA